MSCVNKSSKVLWCVSIVALSLLAQPPSEPPHKRLRTVEAMKYPTEGKARSEGAILSASVSMWERSGFGTPSRARCNLNPECIRADGIVFRCNHVQDGHKRLTAVEAMKYPTKTRKPLREAKKGKKKGDRINPPPFIQP